MRARLRSNGALACAPKMQRPTRRPRRSSAARARARARRSKHGAGRVQSSPNTYQILLRGSTFCAPASKPAIQGGGCAKKRQTAHFATAAQETSSNCAGNADWCSGHLAKGQHRERFGSPTKWGSEGLFYGCLWECAGPRLFFCIEGWTRQCPWISRRFGRVCAATWRAQLRRLSANSDTVPCASQGGPGARFQVLGWQCPRVCTPHACIHVCWRHAAPHARMAARHRHRPTPTQRVGVPPGIPRQLLLGVRQRAMQ